MKSARTNFHMSTQPNLLAQVRRYLYERGEEYNWITMGPDAQKIGLAYVPLDVTGLPCTFMFTEILEPCSLVFDAHFAQRFAPGAIAELTMLPLTINANLPEGQLLLDQAGGFVYYRLKFVVDDPNISDEEIRRRIAHMEQVGIAMSVTYSRIISQEFPC